MKKVIFHVGAHKTGTTTIQKTLSHNHKVFNKNNFFYIPSYKKVGNSRLKKFLSTQDNNDKILWCDYFRKISHDNIIISDEEYSLFSEEKLKKIRCFFEQLGFSVSVHYFIREPFSWKQSDCKQIIRSGNASVEDFNVKTGFDLKKLYRKYRYRHRYANHAVERFVHIPQKLDHVFNEENVYFHYFDDAIKIGLMNYFIVHCLGYNSNCQDLNIEELKTNESLSLTALKIASFRNKYLKNKKNSRILSNLINNLPGNKKVNFVLLNRQEEKNISHGLDYIKRRSEINNIEISKKKVDLIGNIENQDIHNLLSHLNNYFLELEDDLNELKKISKKLESEKRHQMAYKLTSLELKIQPNSSEVKNRKNRLLKKLKAKK